MTKTTVTLLYVLVLLVWGSALISLFLADTPLQRTVTAIFLGGTIVVGLFALRSARDHHTFKTHMQKAASTEQTLRTSNGGAARRTEFVSLASHQLRTPLTAIKGYATMILEGSFGAVPMGTQEAVGRIFIASNTLARIVEDFLNVSLLEQNKMELSFGEVDVCALIHMILEEQHFVATEKNVSITFKNEADASCEIVGDIGKLKQAFTNLIDNAIKYTPHGTVEILFSRHTGRQVIRLEFRDSGIGMSEKTLQKIFEKYQRGRNASEADTTGTGLGLYVARLLFEAHQGKVWATSPGERKGSSFFVELPLTQ